MRVAGSLRDVRERQQRVGRRLDDRERRAVAGTAERVPVARIEAPERDAEPLQDPGRESVEAVVAARGQRQRAALTQEREADTRPGRHAAREDARLGILERSEHRLGLGCDGCVAAAVRRAAVRRVGERRGAIERGREPARRVVGETVDELRAGLHRSQHFSARHPASRRARPSMPASRHQSAADSTSSEASTGIVIAASRHIVATRR